MGRAPAKRASSSDAKVSTTKSEHDAKSEHKQSNDDTTIFCERIMAGRRPFFTQQFSVLSHSPMIHFRADLSDKQSGHLLSVMQLFGSRCWMTERWILRDKSCFHYLVRQRIRVSEKMGPFGLCSGSIQHLFGVPSRQLRDETNQFLPLLL